MFNRKGQENKVEVIATMGIFTEDKSKYTMLDRVKNAEESGINTIRINIANISYDSLESMRDVLLCVRDRFPNIKLLIDIPYPRHKPRTNILSDKKPMIVAKDDIVFFCINNSDYLRYGVDYPCVQIVGLDNFGELIECNEFYYDDGKGSFRIHKVINDYCFFACANSDFILYQNKSIPIASWNPMKGDYFNRLMDFILKINPEILACSFCENANEIDSLRNCLKFKKLFMAKIETYRALDKIVEITKTSDAIMVARGDLAFNVSLDKYKASQDMIISAAKDLNKPVYVATDILSSLQYRQVPSRADIIDLNLLKECNVDGIILSAFIENLINAKMYINRIFK